MQVHLVDGTYELFRHFYGAPPAQDVLGAEVGAVRGVVASVIGLLEQGATHVGVATDHVIESFRNELWHGYKTSEGIDPVLLAQFPVLEDALRALGVTTWPMVEQEADDGLAAAAARAAADARVERVYLCSPDKDLAQCVVGDRIVLLDRRANQVRDAAGIREKFGVDPESIPDYLSLVGDSADGYPGLPGWGAKSTAAVLARYRHLEQIPHDASAWDVNVRGGAKLAATLAEYAALAQLFRDLATLRTDAPVFDNVDELKWEGPHPAFADLCARFNTPNLYRRVRALADARSG